VGDFDVRITGSFDPLADAGGWICAHVPGLHPYGNPPEWVCNRISLGPGMLAAASQRVDAHNGMRILSPLENRRESHNIPALPFRLPESRRNCLRERAPTSLSAPILSLVS
jgi:hypothetical protein